MLDKRRDKDILELFSFNRDAAFRELFDAYYMPLCLFVVQITDEFDESEDLVQSFFVRFWEEKMECRLTTDNIHSFMFSCVRNVALQHLRKQGKKREMLLGEDSMLTNELIDENFNDEQLLEREHKLHNALMALPERERVALESVVLEENSYKDAAVSMGISINTLKTHLKRAIKKLRDSNALVIFF